MTTPAAEGAGLATKLFEAHQERREEKKAAKAEKAEAEREAADDAGDDDGGGFLGGSKGGGKKAPAGKAPARAPGKGGGKSRAPAAPSTRRRARAVSWAWSGNRKVLTAQFLLCVVILVLGTLTGKDEVKSSATRAMIKGSALALLFFLFALLSSAGGSSAKAATAMGTLVTAAYALTSSDVHAVVTWIGDYFGKQAKSAEKDQTEANASPEFEQ